MPKPGVHAERVTRGFSLIELLVVLLIFAILIGIAVPTLTANLPERHLAAAGDMFANDINYARAKAQSTGNPVYLAFVTQPDARQVDAGRDASGNALDPGDADEGAEQSGQKSVHRHVS